MAQADALRTMLRKFQRDARADGEALFRLGRIVWVEQVASKFIGSVRDGYDYTVTWEWIGAKFRFNCDCAVVSGCAHADALARFVLEKAVVVEFEPATPAMELAERLRRSRDPWDARRVLREQLAHPALRLTPYDPRIDGLLTLVEAEEDPELRCWVLAQRLLDVSKGVLPPGLEPYRDRPDLAARHGQLQRDRLAHDLVSWVNSKRTKPTRSLRFVVTPHIRDNDHVILAVSARVSSARLNDDPRTTEQLNQLLNEATNSPGTLEDEQMRVLTAFLGFGHLWSANASILKLLQARPSDPGLIRWDDEIDAAILLRSGIKAGAPVQLSESTVRIVPSITTDGTGAVIQLACAWGDDRTRMLSEVLYHPSSDGRHPSLVIADGLVFIVAHEPPDRIQLDFRKLGGLAIPHSRCAEVVAPLALHYPNVRRVVDEHTRWIDGQGVIALDLGEDDWLHVRAYTYKGNPGWMPHLDPDPGSTVAEFIPNETWRVMTRPPEPPPTKEGDDAAAAIEPNRPIWFEAPDPLIAAAVHDWLTTLAVEPGHRLQSRARRPDSPALNVGWWVYLSAKRMEILGELWERTSASILVACTERLHRLLRGTHSVRPKLRITSSGVDWFAVAAEWESEGLSLSDADMAKLRSATSRFVKLPSGWVRRDAVEAHDEMASVLADLGIEIGGGEQRLTLWQLAGAKSESMAELEKLGADPKAAQALTKLRKQVAKFKGVPEVAVPASITAELRPYQRRGLDFLACTSSLGIGALLADDMGLGKTLQALAWLQWLVDRKPNAGPSLVVCPTSVMHNWVREAEQFAPQLRVLALGRGEERHELRKEIGRYDLVITNYALLRRDIEQWQEIKLRAVVLDEAQNIKNPDAVVSRAAYALQAEHRLALTGTPLENRPLDLWSISNFINPGYLGDRTRFCQRFDRIDAAPHARALLAAKLRPVLLRRLKREVAADLPERIEERRDCQLTEGQRLLYLAELRRSRKLIDELSADDAALRKNKITILAALTRLRQICCHPALAKGKASLGSGKFEALFELLEPLMEEGHKVLLFSQFVQCLELLEQELRARKITCHKLTGETVHREAVVRSFQEDPQPGVFLISLKAGGTGLNLTAASYVILFDPWWNPAVEAQAIDRTHRIGQDRTVIAYRMISSGTIEEKIWQLQQRKSEMARDILGEDGFARALGRDDLSYLLQEV